MRGYESEWSRSPDWSEVRSQCDIECTRSDRRTSQKRTLRTKSGLRDDKITQSKTQTIYRKGSHNSILIMQKDPLFFEGEMLDSIEKIMKYVGTLTFDEFICDEKTFDACCMQLQHIGECGIKLSKIVSKDYKNIPFDQMSGFRNQISHDYAGIDDTIIWKTIKISLPELKNALMGGV